MERLFMASFGRQLSRTLKLPYEGEDFLVGLLANIGASVLLNEKPQEYSELINEAYNNHQKQIKLELEKFGFTQSDLGTALLKNWDIPPILCDSISRQYDTEYFPIDNAIDPKLSALLHLSRFALIEIQESTFHEATIQKSFHILENTFENCKNLWDEIKQSKQNILLQTKIDFDNLL